MHQLFSYGYAIVDKVFFVLVLSTCNELIRNLFSRINLLNWTEMYLTSYAYQCLSGLLNRELGVS